MTKRSKKVCVLIRSDPRTSHRPCEALRLALGLAAGGHRVEVVLAEAASMLLSEAVELAVDGEQARNYLETLKTFVPAVSIDIESLGKNPGPIKTSEIGFETIPLTKAALAKKLGRADLLFYF